MTAPLAPPRRRDPSAKLRTPLLPPAARSRAGLALSALAAEGRFALQVCEACAAVQYPPRDACGKCLDPRLPWRPVPNTGRLIATTTVRASVEPYFRERLPWRVGTVRMDAGPSVLAHLHGDCAVEQAVGLALRLDKAGEAVLLALPATDTPHMEDDPVMRELGSDPKFRRVLVTDARGAAGQALVRALAAAGAAEIFAGIAEPWRPFTAIAAAGVTVVPLDAGDSESVANLAARIGGKVDILVNCGSDARPGSGIVQAREAMETLAFGPMRLAEAFAPAMAARGADGVDSATAWVNVLSVQAYAAQPGYAATSAAMAAALSVSQSLRAQLRPGGVRVIDIVTGPLDDAWAQALPPPKLSPNALAAAVVKALRDGVEQVFAGDVAQDFRARWRDNPDVAIREARGG